MKKYPKMIEVHMSPATLAMFVRFYGLGSENDFCIPKSLATTVYAEWSLLENELCALMDHDIGANNIKWENYDGNK